MADFRNFFSASGRVGCDTLKLVLCCEKWVSSRRHYVFIEADGAVYNTNCGHNAELVKAEMYIFANCWCYIGRFVKNFRFGTTSVCATWEIILSTLHGIFDVLNAISLWITTLNVTQACAWVPHGVQVLTNDKQGNFEILIFRTKSVTKSFRCPSKHYVSPLRENGPRKGFTLFDPMALRNLFICCQTSHDL